MAERSVRNPSASPSAALAAVNRRLALSTEDAEEASYRSEVADRLEEPSKQDQDKVESG